MKATLVRCLCGVAGFVFGAIPSASAQTPVLLKNINQFAPSDSDAFTNVARPGFEFGGRFYFLADDGIHGRELWVSDGTPAGTTLTVDLNPGPDGGFFSESEINDFVAMGGKLYFPAFTPATGKELYSYDPGTGTASLVSDTRPGAGNGVSGGMAVSGSKIFFPSNNGVNGTELWVSDGTMAGTNLVIDIAVGSQSSNASGIEAFGTNEVLFLANDQGTGMGVGNELWRSDGTAAGTTLVADINPGLASSGASRKFEIAPNTVLLAAVTAAEGRELWVTDGTPAGTQLLADLWPGPSGGEPNLFALYNGLAYFFATDGSNVNLYSTNGSVVNTVATIRSGSTSVGSANAITVFDNKMWFGADNGSTGYELWSSDGTAPGTGLFLDINAGPGDSRPDELTVFNGKMYFGAASGPGDSMDDELWVTDGTVAGTQLFIELGPDASSAEPDGVFVFDNALYFVPDREPIFGREWWKSDGTVGGTALFKDIRVTTTDLSSSPALITPFDGGFVFTADDGASGHELWISDGTEPGTQRVRDFFPGDDDGIDPGYNTFTDMGNGTFMFGADDGNNGRELWISDGTDAGTSLVRDINPGPSSSINNPLGDTRTFFNFNGTLLFAANDGTTGTEPWRSNGSFLSTTILANIFSGGQSSTPSAFTQLGNRVIFEARFATGDTPLWYTDNGITIVDFLNSGQSPTDIVDDGTFAYYSAQSLIFGTELHRTDGIDANTVRLTDINFGANNSSPNNIRIAGSNVFFSATDGFTGFELYVYDGVSTTQLKDFDNGPGNGYPTGVFNESIAFGTGLVFAADELAAGNGEELWISDGTPTGTVLLADINPGIDSSSPENFYAFDGKIYFSADDGTNGRELWVTDGTLAGTMMVGDTNPGAGSSNPDNFREVGGMLYFTADDGTTGVELYMLGNPCVGDWNGDGITAVGDILDFLAAWAAGVDPRADINGDTVYAVGDILDFLSAWAAGCP